VSKARRVLAADVGGTKTALAVFSEAADGPRCECQYLLSSDPQRSLADLIEAAIPKRVREGLPAVFAVAGPVRGQRARLTNLPWELSAEDLAETLGLRKLRLINDVEAMAWSLEGPVELVELKGGSGVIGGHRALLSLGTGLGEGGAIFGGGRYLPWAGEGGHCDWAPTGELEWELSLFLKDRLELEHLSRERLLSGEGLVDIARFFFVRHGRDLEDLLVPGGGPAVVQIHRAAREHRDPACVEALDLFVHLLGSEAGNLALVCGAMGGVYIGGGMAVKLGWALKGAGFRRAFLAKGRMRSLLESIPVMLLSDERATLRGAALCALDEEPA